MGYTTTYFGRFDLDRPLSEDQAAYLHRFAKTRRMQRVQLMLTDAPDPWRVNVGLPLGEEGEYYTGGETDTDWDKGIDDPSVLDDSEPPMTQPGLWCDWVPTADRQGIEWNGREKFYDDEDWLRYLIHHFLQPWGYTLSGAVSFQGQDKDDVGSIVVERGAVLSDESLFYDGGVIGGGGPRGVTGQDGILRSGTYSESVRSRMASSIGQCPNANNLRFVPLRNALKEKAPFHE